MILRKFFILICVFGCALFANFRVNGQSGYRLPANVQAIPKAVTKVFTEQYPNVLVHSWYVSHITYWYSDVSSSWYDGWYGTRSTVVYTYDKPSYFEVEFTQDADGISRAFYNAYGYWYETRTQIRGLPLPVLESLEASQYSDWKISKLKERINNPAWPVDVYRFQVSKKLRSRILRFEGKGNFIQSKTIN